MLEILVGTLCGVVSAMGIGGGSLLIIYLNMFMGIGAKEARGINLLYFLICSSVACVFHIKEKMINFKAALWVCSAGVVFAAAGAYIGNMIDDFWLKKIFGGFLVIISLKEFFSKDKDSKTFGVGGGELPP